MSEPDQTQEQQIVGKGFGFSYFLATIANGDFNAELTKAMHELGGALNQHFQDFRGAPKGEISIKLKFAYEPKTGSVSVTADKTVKLPKTPEAGSLLFIDAQNNFVQDDPRQTHMGFPRTGPRPVP